VHTPKQQGKFADNFFVMNNLITSALFSLFVLLSPGINGQVLKNVKDRAEQKAKEKAERKLDETVDKGLDKIEEGIDAKTQGKKKTKTKKKKQEADTDNGENQPAEETGVAEENTGNGKSGKTNSPVKVDSKFDFVPGDKIVLIEDFSSYTLGDFPAKWLSNGTGEVVTLNNEPGKFLQTKKEVIFYPRGLKPLPDDFTLECDLMCNDDFNYYSYEFAIGMTNAKDIKTQWNYFGRFGHGGENNSRVELLLHPNDEGNKEGLTYFAATHKANELMRNNANQNQLSVRAGNTKVHISIWRQKQRVRVYLNDKKVWDIPNAMEAGVNINNIYFRSNGTDNDADAYYLGNIKLATGSADTRNKIVTLGKYSTSNILFDVNSDRIKPESYGVLKEIAAVLTENSAVKVRITGHTDNDGEDAANLLLSQKRAAAVKQALVTQFNIAAARMDTDGKGEAQPLNPNTTAENKAQNRRVEFIKF
jgi:OmpA-OmpF porin, OOP family